jgi:hypothetical protein
MTDEWPTINAIFVLQRAADPDFWYLTHTDGGTMLWVAVPLEQRARQLYPQATVTHVTGLNPFPPSRASGQ